MENSLNSTQDLESTKRRLELVLQGTRLGMWDWNPQTDEVHFDERWANMLGVAVKDLSMTLEDWTSRVHPDDIEGCFADIQTHIDGKVNFYENTHRMMHSDGRWRYILDRGQVMERDAEGKPTRFTGTHTDVTILKEAELTANKALADRDRFFSQISHELRTPLHGILGTTDHLLRNRNDAETQRYLEVIQYSGDTLLSLLNDLLEISKISAGAIEVHAEPMDVLEIANRTLSLFASQADDNDLEVSCINHTGKSELFVDSDKHRLSQIFSNLISNAIKFTDKGCITVEFSDQQGELVCQLRDTGVGIEDPARVFDEYTQEIRGQSLKGIQGTGLGLFIVKSLCELLGIGITCASKLHEGTVFTLRLGKLLVNHVPQPECANAKDVSELRFKKVLLVDDNTINLMIGEVMLAEMLHQVVSCDSGEQALRHIQEEGDYDLVMLDINMPEMDGYELARRIRQLEGVTPVLLAQTADVMNQHPEKLKHLGFDGCISKPFEYDRLREILGKL